MSDFEEEVVNRIDAMSRNDRLQAHAAEFMRTSLLHSKLNSGTAVTKRVPLWTRSANWVRTSWAMFQGKMTT